MFSTAKINPQYSRGRQPGAHDLRAILQRNPNENAAKKHVILKAEQLPAIVELYSDDATNPDAAVAKLMEEVSAYLIALYPAFKFVLHKVHPLKEIQAVELAQNDKERKR